MDIDDIKGIIILIIAIGIVVYKSISSFVDTNKKNSHPIKKSREYNARFKAPSSGESMKEEIDFIPEKEGLPSVNYSNDFQTEIVEEPAEDDNISNLMQGIIWAEILNPKFKE